jgi:hypothetical protein
MKVKLKLESVHFLQILILNSPQHSKPSDKHFTQNLHLYILYNVKSLMDANCTC